MVVKRKTLGRGLEKLLSNTGIMDEIISATEEKTLEGLQQLELHLLQSGKYQPRRDIDLDALDELANSIRQQGVLQPIVVRPIAQNKYEIIAGERRWRAAQLAGLPTIPVIIKDVSDEATMAIALIENIQRENLNPIEEALAIERLLNKCSLTHQQVAHSIGKSRTTVTNLLRLISLSTEVKEWLARGDLELGHAKVLLALEGAPQIQAARMILAKGLSVRETEKIVQKMQTPAPLEYAKKQIDPDVKQLQNILTEKLNATVNISHSNKGKGKLVIFYNNLDELDLILEHIK